MTAEGEDALFKCCPIGCSSALENTPIRLAEGRLRRCPECGQLLSSCSRAWFDQSMQEFNVPQGTLPEGGNKARYHQRMGKILSGARAIIDNDKQPLRLLDVGCSSGALLLVAKQCGYDCFGAEPAAQAAATAQGLGFDVFPGHLQDAGYADGHFDVVTLFEVIEHLLAPDALLREIRRILRPGGLLLIGTGNAESWTATFLQDKWEYFDIRSHGGHVSFFNPKSISLLGRKCGFDVHSIATRRVNLAERKDVSGTLYRLVRIARELLAIPARWTNRGHDMLAILRKPGQ
jgi:SAM-dependent methyltransferase